MANELYVKYHGSWVKLLDLYINGITPPYLPTVWNDSGVFSYFYIDFKKSLKNFSTGQFNYCILIMGSSTLTATLVQEVSAGVYKVTCDISTCRSGLIVACVRTDLLMFIDESYLPSFAVMIPISGILEYLDLGYISDTAYMSMAKAVSDIATIGESTGLDMLSPVDVSGPYDSCIYTRYAPINPVENIHSVVLT